MGYDDRPMLLPLAPGETAQIMRGREEKGGGGGGGGEEGGSGGEMGEAWCCMSHLPGVPYGATNHCLPPVSRFQESPFKPVRTV